MDTSRKLNLAWISNLSTESKTRDQVGNKPWGDMSPTAQLEFWNASSIWLPTWGNGTDRGLSVRSVKMFSLGACGAPQPS
jgi:hypothetical protein